MCSISRRVTGGRGETVVWCKILILLGALSDDICFCICFPYLFRLMPWFLSFST